MPVYLAVAVGGALGTLTRYSVDRLIERRVAAVFPWSTFTINITGCVVIGVIIAALVDRHHTPEWLRLGIVMGFVGGYTTFSTYAQESYGLLRGGHAAVGIVYASGSVVVGVLAVALGTMIGRQLAAFEREPAGEREQHGAGHLLDAAREPAADPVLGAYADDPRSRRVELRL